MSLASSLRSLGVIHTVSGLVPVFNELFAQHLPGWKPFHIVDETLLNNTIRAGRLEPATSRRLASHVWAAEDAGAEAAFITCSSIGPAVEAARALASIPLIRVDSGMAARAIELGRRIGVLATLPTTLGPTSDLVEATAKAKGVNVSLLPHLCDGAFAALASGDRAQHNALIRHGLASLISKVDVVILAQASMASALEGALEPAGPPVLSSPELGVKYLAQALEAL